MRSLFASLDEKPFTSRITLQPNIVLEKSQQMSSQYLCGTARPSTSHVVHEVMVMDREGRMRAVKALIDCGASSFFISPKLVRYLGLREQTSPAYITTRGLDGKILARARDSQKLSLKMQYLDHLAPVEEPEVLVVDMSAYDLVLGIPWFERHNPDIDWLKKRLMALRNPIGSSVSKSVSSIYKIRIHLVAAVPNGRTSVCCFRKSSECSSWHERRRGLLGKRGSIGSSERE